ncbi:hypothetical protein GCM10027176_82220 [Actinoallomurus bryophytorum]|uniref:zinc-binding dehydrogenase n=1 Tax=Actinoallomurus bryophytorum TaxID=1490222 RepID=UPI001FE2992E|nr:zinc-binding dehydrogenase [Actinoallomurus bryophytorum]
MLDPGERERRGVTVRGIEHLQLAPDDMRRMLPRALSEAPAGRMRPVIGQTFPLERAADAHRAIEARAVVGRTLLVTGENERDSRRRELVCDKAGIARQPVGPRLPQSPQHPPTGEIPPATKPASAAAGPRLA